MTPTTATPSPKRSPALRPWGLLALLTGCEMPIALAPQGPAAAEMAHLWWVLFWTAAVVSLIVFAL
ncbi:MAG: cytochrome c oxidase subunit II, partial [Deinococcota bacterium]|nr:cytochrome c oxidase subunit II [Deinococcota bacterium]